MQQPILTLDLTRSYSAQEVQKILQIVQEEYEKSIDTAFAEGYKQGLLEALPQKEYYKVLSEDLQVEAKKLEQNNKLKKYFVSLSFVFGFSLGFIVPLITARF